MIETKVATRPVFASQGFKMLVLHVNLNTAISSSHALFPGWHRINVILELLALLTQDFREIAVCM